jgi:aspartyl-tRNA(Asn)/glutamyl-tRNA(Gln) amidotransferase subunit B
VEGDDKLRGKLTGFFVGQVMEATHRRADGGAVTALLRQRAGARPKTRRRQWRTRR